jgi:hypothetical protein
MADAEIKSIFDVPPDETRFTPAVRAGVLLFLVARRFLDNCPCPQIRLSSGL